MKILLVTQFYYPERFSTTDIAEELVKLGNEVTVLTGKPNYGYGYILKEYKKVKEENINGVKVLRVNLKPRKHSRISIIRNYLSFHRNAKRYVRKLDNDFDIVLSISLSPVTFESNPGSSSRSSMILIVFPRLFSWNGNISSLYL